MYPKLVDLKVILTSEQYVSLEDSQKAELNAKNSQDYIDYLISHELLSKPLLGQAMAEYYSTVFADLGAKPIAQQQADMMPADIAHQNRVVFFA